MADVPSGGWKTTWDDPDMLIFEKGGAYIALDSKGRRCMN